jgi:hypothetical protein
LILSASGSAGCSRIGASFTRVAARPLSRSRGVLGGGSVKQVKYLPGVQAERAAGDEDQVGDLQRDHC